MLGGLGELGACDVSGSRRFITHLNNRNRTGARNRALDVGARIGRVTKHLLLPLSVDMLEQNHHYLIQSTVFLGNTRVGSTVDKRIACGMQHFRADGAVLDDCSPTRSLLCHYDLIWIQWCILYLTDRDFISFLIECGKTLTSKGVICIKESVIRRGFLVDKDDSSIMRSDEHLKHLFQKADLEIIRESKQMDSPTDIFPIKTYALRTCSPGGTP